MSTNTPFWTGDTTAFPETTLIKSDVLSVDTTSPDVMQSGTVAVMLGNGFSGEPLGKRGQVFGPSGLISVPVISALGGTGIETLSWHRNDENFVFGLRDLVNRSKAGTVNAGETCLFAPGATGSNKLYLDINGNATLSVQNQINLISNANLITLQSSTINLGNSSPTFNAAISQKTDTNFSTIMSAAQTAVAALGATPTPPTVAAALVAFVSALAAPYPTTMSNTVKISG
jgi:hypothetical protein